MTLNDINSLKLALIEREQYYQLFMTASDLMVITDSAWTIMKTNPAFTEILGYSDKELLTKLFVEYIHPEDKQYTLDEITRQLKKSPSANFENRYLCKDGSFKWMSWRVKVNKDEGIAYASARDITDIKKAREHLVSIMKAVESSGDAIGISDSKGHHYYHNKALSELFEYATAEELEAAGGGKAVVKDPNVAIEMFDKIMHGKAWAGELEMVTKSGRVFPALERADAIKDEKGNIIGFIGIITDITDRKNVEAEKERVIIELKTALANIKTLKNMLPML